MKTLTKIKLINWHGFYDETIEIKGATLITGENGCGKSTLIDALYFLLTGGEDNNFNSAANENAQRTIVTYMRGKTGVEGKEFLRNDNDLISHIALEFFDDSNNTSLVIGVVLEIQDSKLKVGKSFYHIVNGKINDELFYAEKDGKRFCLNYRSMEKKLDKEHINALDYQSSSRSSIRKNIYSILDLNNKYYDILPKAIAFKPISEVSDFVYKFLMPESDINIENIRQNIHAYNEIQIKISQDKEKKQDLEKITFWGDKYKTLVNEKQLLEGYKLKKALCENEKIVEKAEQQIIVLRKNLEQEKINETDYETQLKSIEETIYSLTHCEAYLAKKQIEDELTVENRNYEEIKEKVSKFNKWILAEAEIADALEINIHFQKYLKTKDHSAFLETLTEYKRLYDIAVEKINKNIYELETSLTKLSVDKKSLTDEKEKLLKGLPSYSSEVSSLISVIVSGIKADTNEDVCVTPLCEMLEISEGQEEWRDAVEGYLNTRRFDLFVPERFYDKALNLYEKYKFEKRISGIGLVNHAKIKDVECNFGSLAEKVYTENKEARKYVNYLMGNVSCVESEDDLKGYEKSITKTVMVYQNKAARQTKREVYATPYIGRESLRIRLKSINEKLGENEKITEISLNKKSNFEALRRKTKDSNYSLIYQTENIWDKCHRVLGNIKTLKARLLEATKNTSTLDPKIDVQKQLHESAQQKKKHCSNNIIQLNMSIKDNIQSAEKAKKAIEQITPFIRLLEQDVTLWKEVESFFEEYQYSVKECSDRIDALKIEIAKVETHLPSLMSMYITKFGFDANAELDSLNVFYQEYNEVVLRDLERWQEKLQEVKQLASCAFQESYIAEIRKHIKDEKDNINKLNKILQNKPFGADEEIYQFEIKRSTDKKFGDYYNIFMSDEDYDTKSLFTDQLSDKNYQLMQDLFVLLTQDTQSEKQDKIIREFTDYRKFMSYDIKITNKRGEVSYFSKINREKSGGETQTPFYVIIAASFDQIIHSSFGRKSPGCLVMLDEAFNNMDGSHIDSMMQYFTSLDIQPLIAVPSPRAKTIMPYVDTTVALVKCRDRIIPKSHIRNNL